MVEETLIPRGTRMPQNLEAERALLGCLILDNRQIDIVLDIFPHGAISAGFRPLRGGDGKRGAHNGPPAETLFFSPAHQTIFESVFTLHDSGGGIDLTTLANHLHGRGQLESVGGAAYLAGLEDDIFALSQVPEYARIILQKWRLRCLIRAATSVVDEAMGSASPVQDIIERAEKQIFEIGADQQQKDFVHIEGPVMEQLQEIEDRAKGIGEAPGLQTGFTELDRMTTGFRPAQMIIIAARPAMGKTAFVMNIATHVATHSKRPVGIFSLEMSSPELVQRILCTLAHVHMSRVRGNTHLRRDELEALHEAGERLASSPLYIDDTSNLSILEMRSRARRLKARCPNLGMIVIDYLQLMSGGAGRNESRQQEVSEISRSLKLLARELSIPVVALSQLSRQTEQRRGTKDDMPRLSDLRECVTGDTPVQLADGRRVPVASLVGTMPEVIAVDAAGRLIQARAEAVWCVGRRPVIRVTLASGRSIRTTADHRLLGAKGWVRVGELPVGDRLAYVPEECLQAFYRADCEIISIGTHGEKAASAGVENWSPSGSGRLTGAYPGFANTLHPGLLKLDPFGVLVDEELGRWAESDLFWDRVVSLEPAGEEEVFDLTVPGPHSWLAGEIVSHNSGAIEQDADVVIFINRRAMANPEEKKPGEPEEARIRIGKQRNGAIGDFSMLFIGDYTEFVNMANPDRT